MSKKEKIRKSPRKNNKEKAGEKENKLKKEKDGCRMGTRHNEREEKESIAK